MTAATNNIETEIHEDINKNGHKITGIAKYHRKMDTLIEGYCESHLQYYYILNETPNCKHANLLPS